MSLRLATPRNECKFKELANPAIAFPLDVGDLTRFNISFERADMADAGFPSFQRDFVVAGGQSDSKSALFICNE